MYRLSPEAEERKLQEMEADRAVLNGALIKHDEIVGVILKELPWCSKKQLRKIFAKYAKTVRRALGTCRVVELHGIGRLFVDVRREGSNKSKFPFHLVPIFRLGGMKRGILAMVQELNHIKNLDNRDKLLEVVPKRRFRCRL